MSLFDQPPTLESLLARIEALEAKVMEKPARQRSEVPDELRQAWSLWYLHKASDKRWSAVAKKQQMAKLAEFSNLNPALAMQIVEEAIEKGWATFYPPKNVPKLAAVKTVKEAMKPSETPLERDIGRARHDCHLGLIDTAERDRRISAATQKYRATSPNEG